MRLTLRTLLAWLDDELPPKDVTRIGRQLHRSKFAQDLGRRIQKVMRQRRLSVPGMGKNTPVDANIIAAYLDNSLPQDQTNALESFCLNSDVHLAEVASSHQVLSMLDQPVRLTPEQYNSMYRLVKGPETRISAQRVDGFREKTSAQSNTIEPASERISTQNIDAESAEPTAGKSANQLRISFIGVVVVLISCMLSLSVWLDRTRSPLGVRIPVRPAADQNLQAEENAPEPPDVAASDAQNPMNPLESGNAPLVASVEPATKPMPIPMPIPMPMPEPAAIPKSGAEPGAKPGQIKPELIKVDPTGLFNKVKALNDNSIVFWSGNSNPANPVQNWQRFNAQSDVQSGRLRFATSQPTQVTVDDVRIAFKNGSLVEWTNGAEPRLILESGCIRLESDKPFEMTFYLDKNTKVLVEMDAKSAVLLNRTASAFTAANYLEPVSQKVELIVASGSGTVRSDPSEMTLEPNESALLTYSSQSRWSLSRNENPTDAGWPTEMTSLELTSQQMKRWLGTPLGLAVQLVEAQTESLQSVKQLSLQIALWVNRGDLVSESLRESGNPELRRAAIEALRHQAQAGDAGVVTFMDTLCKELGFGPAEKQYLAQLLVPPTEKPDAITPERLVASLENESVLVRDLALEHLMKISSRDSLEYSPDEPTEQAISSWKEWLKSFREKQP